MKIHVLPGDALTETFQQTDLAGEIVVCRECLVEGPVRAETPDEFWKIRAQFIAGAYAEDAENYFGGVVSEFERLKKAAEEPGAEVYLWFEYELFCQANLWFCLSFLDETGAKIYRVAPVVRSEADLWKGFGKLSAADLEKCFAARVELSAEDLRLGADLWAAYRDSDFETLEKLSSAESPAFPHLEKACRAEIEKKSRPREILEEIIAEGKTDFNNEIFPAFATKAGVYGFGDSQVKRIMAEI